MIRRAHGLPWLLVTVLLAGCAVAAPGAQPERQSSPPRVRCLSEPERDAREGTRPLLFFFCIESP
ncbi:MAG: hypothetical protein DME12_10430 [Candidatus Rokuibacteriota bacterium]|nr:MAG: hypothetical protein DME12_10430 [Candidatus Rokubacteria bacterium]PYM65207.1 MAG: hypothetical protein DME11_11160 [Candidatus Rokubacteria bacterium]PYN69064.1 MAG: hypothetical protein DMD93_08075 [Candidatus Rokubacteria bacterium]